MAENSKIEWTDHTFNPWLGCTKVSPACDHCYAESWAKRAGNAARVVWGGERRRTSESTWRQPLKWNAQAQAEGRRYRVFCASLADVFDNQVPDEWRGDLFTLIAKTPHLDWLLLTKRIGNVQKMLSDIVHSHDEGLSVLDMMGPDGGWYRNVWIGATICDQAEADRDIPKLLEVPARVRFLSVEPMLAPISLHDEWMGRAKSAQGPVVQMFKPPLSWVICGGESGPQARPMHPDWARSLRDQCAEAGVPFLFKQWGEHAPNWLNDDAGNKIPGSEWIDRIGKKAAGRLLDGRTHDAFPEA